MIRNLRYTIAVAVIATSLVLPAAAQAVPSGGSVPAATEAGAATIFYRTTDRFLEVKRRHPAGYNWTDDKIAAVLTYIRQEWGNAAGPITTEQVAAIRAKEGDRKAWTADELAKLP